MRDRLHWSFGEKNESLLDWVFPESLSSPGFQGTGKSSVSDDWDAHYLIAYTRNLPFLARMPRDGVFFGDLHVKKREAGDAVRLEIAQVMRTREGRTAAVESVTSYECTANRDAFSTLGPGNVWRREYRVPAPLSPEVDSERLELKDWARVTAECVLERSTDGVTFQPVASVPSTAPLTNNWALMFLALAGLKIGREPLRVHMIDSSGGLRLNHSIRFLEPFVARFGNTEMPLVGYVHTGEGMLPSYYWYDERKRLIIAKFGLMAYVYNEAT